MFGLADMLRPGETTTGMPFAEMQVERAERTASEERLTMNMLSQHVLGEDKGNGVTQTGTLSAKT